MKDTRDMMVKDYDTCTDEELIARLRAGEREITDYLIDKYKSLVRTRARALYLVGGDHEDLIQEGMLGLFKAVRDYKPGKEASFATFAGLCIDRQMYSAVASSQRQKHQPLNSFVSLSEPVSEQELRLVDEETPEEIMISRENVIGMHERIKERLSKFEYQVLELYLKGYDYTQIAEKLGKQPKAIDNALQRIRSKVREVCKAFLSPSELLPTAQDAVSQARQENALEGELQALQRKIDSLTATLDQMYMDKLSGILSDADFQRIYQKVKMDRAQLEEKRKELERQQESPVPQEDRARELVQRFIDSVPTNRELLFSLIERIELSESKEIYIKFRFKQLNFDCFGANS